MLLNKLTDHYAESIDMQSYLEYTITKTGKSPRRDAYIELLEAYDQLQKKLANAITETVK